MDNLKGTISNVSKTVYKTSKSFLKSTKLSMDLSGEESKLKSLYTEIGKKVHEIYAYGGSLGKFFDAKYLEIMECERKIEGLRKELDAAKGTKTCDKCGKAAPLTAEFCPKCGARLDKTADEAAGPEVMPDEPARCFEEPEQRPAEHMDEPEQPKAAAKKCPLCGAENTATDKFCFSCGRVL